MEYDIRRIDNQTAIAFLKASHVSKTDLFIRAYDVWYASYVNGKIVCVNGATDKGKYVSTGGWFTLPEYRRQGHGTATKTRLLADFPGRAIQTFSRPIAADIEEKHFGFTRGRSFSNGTVYMSRPGTANKNITYEKPVDWEAIKKWRDIL